LWSDFKSSVRVFNNKKNNFYKLLKKEQTENLRRKQELTDIAEQNKDSENFETTLVLMKSIQNQWKEIGHIPRKQSNKLWKRFKSSCNHFFDRYHEINSNGTIEENEAFKQKQELLETLKSFKIGSKKNDNIKKGEALSVLIGPEGDFSPAERESILKVPDVKSFSISKNILRSDTAVITAISLVNFVYFNS